MNELFTEIADILERIGERRKALRLGGDFRQFFLRRRRLRQ